MYTTSSSWRGPFSTWATASPPSSPGPPVGMSGTQVWPLGRVSARPAGRPGIGGVSLCWRPILASGLSPLTRDQFCSGSASILWVATLKPELSSVPELAQVEDGDAFASLCQIQKLSPLGSEWGCEGFRLQFQPYLSGYQIFLCKMKGLDYIRCCKQGAYRPIRL